jgi:hypothetical protein
MHPRERRHRETGPEVQAIDHVQAAHARNSGGHSRLRGKSPLHQFEEATLSSADLKRRTAGRATAKNSGNGKALLRCLQGQALFLHRHNQTDPLPGEP